MKDFIKDLTKEPLVDLLVSGYVDEQGDLFQFHLMYERIYFSFANSILELSVNEDAYIKVRKLEKIKAWFEVVPDDEFALMSIYAQVFKTQQQIVISEINYEEKPLSGISLIYK